MMDFKQFLANESRQYDYSSLLIEPSDELVDNIISWGFDHVPNESLFFDTKDPGFGREDDIHITIIYGIHTQSVKAVENLFDNEKCFECTLGKINVFNKNPKFDVLIIEVNCENLHRLNQKMRKELEATENHPIYVPHVTICYLTKGLGNKFIGDKTFFGEKFKVNKVFFSSKYGKKTTIELRK